MGVSPLDDGYRGFADRENVTGLNQIPCVVAQHIDCVVEGAQQMRFQRKHLAVLTKPVVSLGGLQNGRPAQRHNNALAAFKTSEGTVVHPVDIHPDRVHTIGDRLSCGSAEADADLDSGAFAAFHDVGRPVPVGPCFLIGMIGGDCRSQRHIAQVGAADQHGIDLQLRHHHLHACMWVGDLDPSLQVKIIAFGLDVPVQLAQHQWRGWPQTMASFDPEHSQPDQEQDQKQNTHVNVGFQPFSMARSVRRPRDLSARDHFGVEFVETEAHAFALRSGESGGLTDGGVDLLQWDLSLLVKQHLAVSINDHHLRNDSVPVMRGIGSVAVCSSLKCVSGQWQKVHAVSPEPLQFRNSRGEGLARSAVIEVVDDHARAPRLQ